jgi:putative transposase
MTVFLDDSDHEAYLRFLQLYVSKYGLEILAYCLMPNHVHLVAVPKEMDSLARAIACTHVLYSRHFNRKYSLSGHLWQGRYYSCVLDEQHTLAATRYVECNPVHAGLVGCAWNYRWSSAQGHLGKIRDPILSANWPHPELLSQWQQLLTEQASDVDIEKLRDSTRAGYPLGSAQFIDNLERILGRSLSRKRVGRPRKSPEGER